MFRETVYFFEAIVNIFNLILKTLRFFCGFRNSSPKVFLRKGILKIFTKFTGEHPCRSVTLTELPCNFIENHFIQLNFALLQPPKTSENPRLL